MRTKQIKLLILCLAGIVLLACAHREPLQLPPPIISDDPDSGWHNY